MSESTELSSQKFDAGCPNQDMAVTARRAIAPRSALGEEAPGLQWQVGLSTKRGSNMNRCAHLSKWSAFGALVAVAVAASGCVAPQQPPGSEAGSHPPDLGGFPPIDFGIGPGDVDIAMFPGVPWPEALQTQPVAPPAISGGTLAVLADGVTAVAADPDRDRVYAVDLVGHKVVADIALTAGDEPGRVVEDGAARVHVVLRGAGAIATLDLASQKVVARRPVCAAPRGLAWEKATDELHVACAGGELVSLPAAGGAAVRTLQLDRDLRDVVVDGATLVVTRFRSAEVLRLDGSGKVIERTGPVAADGFSPHVAWRAAPIAGGGVVVVHQIESTQVVPTMLPGGYGGGFKGADGGTDSPGIVQGAVAVIKQGQTPAITPSLFESVLPVDVALSPDGTRFAVVAAGNRGMVSKNVFPLYEFSLSDYLANISPGMAFFARSTANTISDAVAVAYARDGRILVQTREPATLQIDAGGQNELTVSLSNVSRYDTGHAVFHTSTVAGIACASCHPEGGDDGHTWRFDFGARRTQSLRGGVIERAPFHWSGDLPGLPMLLTTVMQTRMSGPALTAPQASALGGWLDALPDVPKSPPSDAAAAGRGKTLFNDPTVACASCHGGGDLSNRALVDVGTNGTFKVASLVGVGFRQPYLHNGCAATLADRFNPACGGGDRHGHTSQLTPGQIQDLVAYLETL
jgi:hypothetical protein